MSPPPDAALPPERHTRASGRGRSRPRPGGRAQWDAVVVGARVAGASTAMLLARAGARVLVVDRARRGSDTLSTHALMRGGVLQLRRWGLLDRLAAAGTPPVRRVTFHYGGEQPMPVSLRPYAGVDALYAPRRTVLDTLLVGAAESAGAQVRFGTAMTSLAFDGDGRVVGVKLRDGDGRVRTEYADLVVGADGRDSLVAARVAATTLATGAHAPAYLYGYWPGAGVDGYHWHYGDGLSAGVIPTDDGLVCVFVGGPPAVIAAALRERRPAEAQRELLRRLDGPRVGPHAGPHPGTRGGSLGELAAVPPEGPVRFFRGLAAQLRQAHGPGWALAGDAGWWKDPLSTHGITDALRDAELLAAAVVAGTASEGAAAVALARYQAQRDVLALAMHPVVDRLAAHDWSPAEARGLLRELSSVMADEVEAIRRLDLPATPSARTA
jgi:2-polyprenyl-6-methoxyphenol hydroxylase-like FAD-dependent oxidoreductase